MAWVYILTERKFGTLYIGATTNLVQRVWQHRNEVVPVKHWKAEWKVTLIEQDNPEWDDLYLGIAPGRY